MNEEQDPKPGGRFLSKVVKFVTSPTTDWADLNKVGGPADASESSAALKRSKPRSTETGRVEKFHCELNCTGSTLPR